MNTSLSKQNQAFAVSIQGRVCVCVCGGGGGGAGGTTSYVRVKKTINFCEMGPFKSVSCCRFRFPNRCSDKNQDKLRVCSKKQGIYIGNDA